MKSQIRTITNLLDKVVKPGLLALSVILPTSSAFAFEPLVICGGNDPAGNVELDNITVYRGGTHENQLVIRNTNIIDDFVAKGAIYRGELNDRGEFIISGLENQGPHNSQISSRHSVTGNLNNRHFSFYRSENGYVLTVQLIGDNRIDLSAPIADFYFTEDCQSY